MSTLITPQVFSQVVKNVHDATSIVDAAKPTGVFYAIQKTIYKLMDWDFPAEKHFKEMEKLVSENRSEILEILSSIELNGKGNLPGASNNGKSAPFSFLGSTYQFEQIQKAFYVVRLESDDTSATGSHPSYTRREIYPLGEVNPRKLKSEALRSYIEHQRKNGLDADLTKFNLKNVDDITKFSFSGVTVDAENLLEFSDVLASAPNLPRNSVIDLRGARLTATTRVNLSDVNLKKFVIDSNMALQLIAHGANYAKVFAQYVRSRQISGIDGFDISCFDLSKANCTGLDLRQANMRPVILRNNQAELANLKNAKLTPYVQEMLQMATSPTAILTHPAVRTSRSLAVVDRPKNAAELSIDAFVQFADELDTRHAQKSTLGNIALRNLRMHGQTVYYLNDGVRSKIPTAIVSDDLLFENEISREEIDLAVDQPRQLGPVKKDQYDFFGVVIQAVTGKSELQLMPPHDRYHPDDIEALYNQLPCGDAEKSDWLGFMLDPEGSELHFPLHEYLIKPGTPYVRLPSAASAAASMSESVRSMPEADRSKPMPETNPVPVQPVRTVKSEIAEAAPTEIQVLPRREVTNLFEVIQRGEYQFDVSHFTDLARALQKNLTPKERAAKGLNESSTGQTISVISTLKQPLEDSIYFENGQVRLSPECETNEYPAKTLSRIARHSVPLDFFGVMIKAGVADCQVLGEAWLGTTEAPHLGLAWKVDTAVAFVNMLPCDRVSKIELAKFLSDPAKYPLPELMESYLSVPIGMVGNALITRDEVPDPENVPKASETSLVATAPLVQKDSGSQAQQHVAPTSLVERVLSFVERALSFLFGGTPAKPISVAAKSAPSATKEIARSRPAATRANVNWKPDAAVSYVNSKQWSGGLKIEYARFLINRQKWPLPRPVDQYSDDSNPFAGRIQITVADVLRVQRSARGGLIDETLSYSERRPFSERGTVGLKSTSGNGRPVSTMTAKPENGVIKVAPASKSAVPSAVPVAPPRESNSDRGITGSYNVARGLPLRTDDDRF